MGGFRVRIVENILVKILSQTCRNNERWMAEGSEGNNVRHTSLMPYPLSLFDDL